MNTGYAAPKDITLIADPKVLAIPVQESGERCIDLRSQNVIKFGPSPEVDNNTDYTYMRAEIYKRIVEAQKSLPQGIKFRIYEAYRSIKLQKILFDERFANIKAKYPTWSHTDLFNETIKLVSPITNLDGSSNIPPHATGGAFDIYLIDENEEPLDMGIHPANWLQDTTGQLSQTNSKVISTTAQKNRNIMSTALTNVGFTNYPTEFWHWSFGDRYWAFMQHKPYAIYDVLEDGCLL